MPSPGLSGLGGPCPHPLSLCSSSPGPVLLCAGLGPSPGPYLLPPGVAVPWGPPPWGLWGPGTVLPRGLPMELLVPGSPARSGAGPCPQQQTLPSGICTCFGFLNKTKSQMCSCAAPSPALLPVPGTPSAPPFTSVQSCSPPPGLCFCVPPGALPPSHLIPPPPAAPAFLQLLPRRLPRARCAAVQPPRAAPLCDSGETQHGGGGSRVPRQGTVDVFCLSVPPGPGSD